MATTSARFSPVRLCTALLLVLTAAAAAQSAAALHVYEPFDYPAPSVLEGTTATGLNLAGTYDSLVTVDALKLRVSAPGLTYGALQGAPATAGGKITQLQSTSSDRATIGLAPPLEILAGQAIFFSALFTLDDSRNGNHRAQVSLGDGDENISFGEPAVGGRAIRASASTSATGGVVASTGGRSSFTNGQTLLLIGRYNNSALPLGDRLELLGYDAAASRPFPTVFDPADPNAVLYQELRDIDIDLARISAVSFIIRGANNNFIDELRIGSTVADVAPIPEAQTWLLMACGLAAVAAAARRRRGGMH